MWSAIRGVDSFFNDDWRTSPVDYGEISTLGYGDVPTTVDHDKTTTPDEGGKELLGNASETVTHLRPPLIYVLTDSKSRARSESNKLAYEIKVSSKFHDRQEHVKDKEEEEHEEQEEQEEEIGEAEVGVERGKTFVRTNRPRMAAALAVGTRIYLHSSVKGINPLESHPIVQKLLDKMGVVIDGRVYPNRDKYGARAGYLAKWHGRCAEVGAVSEYLRLIDPSGRMMVEEAKAHFRERVAEIFAHEAKSSDGTPATEYTAEVPACSSCTFILTKLGIRHLNLRKPIGGARNFKQWAGFN